MLKKALLFLLLALPLFAQSYSFTELRYSYSINRYTQLEGEISFYKDGLRISYPKDARELEYKDDSIRYLQNSKELPLNDMQEMQMMHYFDILRLLHSGDESEIKEMFDIELKGDKKILTPRGSIGDYIDYIELFKVKERLYYIKLYLQNSDTISINIDD